VLPGSQRGARQVESLGAPREPALGRFRKHGVLLVLVIELFRSGRVDESQAILAELESAGFGAWTRISLALGLAGREPWGDYPFSDW
jgi:hypothetical protein